MTFKELLDHGELLRAIEELGYKTPTPIQSKAIPAILRGSNLRASAETGTGKTAAFLLPLLLRLTHPATIAGRGPRVLVLVPTRELAIQVADEAIRYSKYLKRIKTVCIYGGAPYPLQNRQLSQPYEILVATPGRLIDHLDRGKIDFSRLEVFILDEADRMLDMGFIEPVEQIAAALPKKRQTLLFSATLKKAVFKLSERLLTHPQQVDTEDDPLKHENIEQNFLHADNLEHKYRLLQRILTEVHFNQAIVFTATKFHADTLVQKLIDQGHSAAALHGDMPQRRRTKTVEKLREGTVRILVATDVAGRGIDIPAVSHVINFDLPKNVEDYVHRIGRTGRAGASGNALSFVTHKERNFIRQIEMFTKKKIPFLTTGQRETGPLEKTTVSSGKEREPLPKKTTRPGKRPFFKKKTTKFYSFRKKKF